VRKKSSALIPLLATPILALLIATNSIAQSQDAKSAGVIFQDYFVDKALRMEFYQCGDSKEVDVTLHELFEESTWPDRFSNLIQEFHYGKFAVKVYDVASDRLIFKRGFDTMFAEYATTTPALNGVKRVFQCSLRCPFPKAKIRVDIERCDKQNHLKPIYTTIIDPAGYQIRKESMAARDTMFEVLTTGDSHERVDVVFVSEGYLADEQEKFKRDVERMAQHLFSVEPYKVMKDRFNVRGIFRPSAERGTDEPRQGSFKSTLLHSSYNTFDLDRYLLLEENHLMHRIAAQVPYDTIVVLVNTTRYGGGSICLDYCVSSTDHPTSTQVFLHEFGHSFAFLADEYIGNVAYNDMYPDDVEPFEPNITRELDPQKIKWKNMLSPGVSLPTPTADPNAETLVGAFEGGGYLDKGMFRSQLKCWMGSMNSPHGFCVACRGGILKMIEFHSQ
jgi:IgA Peptidase M64/Peptidase M64 N-terminus